MYAQNDQIVSRTGTLTSFTTSQTIASCIHLPSTYSFRIHKFLDFSYEDNLTQTPSCDDIPCVMARSAVHTHFFSRQKPAARLPCFRGYP